MDRVFRNCEYIGGIVAERKGLEKKIELIVCEER
jgi:hypothetical protein